MPDPNESANHELHTTSADVANAVLNLSMGVIADGHNTVLRAAKQFTSQDSTMARTMYSIKQLAAPLQDYANQMQSVADSSMEIAVAQQKIQRAYKSTMSSSTRGPTGRARTASQSRGIHSASSRSSADADERRLSNSLDSFKASQLEIEQVNQKAADAARDREQAEASLAEAEAAMSAEDMLAIDSIINGVMHDDDLSPRSAMEETFDPTAEGSEQYRSQLDEDGQRYSVDYYKTQAAGVKSTGNYSGAYKKAMEQAAVEARERAELERKDAENRAYAAMSKSAQAKLAQAEQEMSEDERLAIEAIIAGEVFE